MKITIETIPHSDQAYETVGDWRVERGVLKIRVSLLSDWRREVLVAIHELVEFVLCKDARITPEQVDAFDIAFEKKRRKGNVDEPGDDPQAPYVRQHCIATGIERILAAELGVNWQEYEKELESLL